MSKMPITVSDYRLHTSPCVMACSFNDLKPKNKPKLVISLSEGLRTRDSTNPVTFHSQE